jgi:uncharacterized membrane protein
MVCELLTEAAGVDVWIKIEAWVVVAARAVPQVAALAVLVELKAARAARQSTALARTTVAGHFEFFLKVVCWRFSKKNKFNGTLFCGGK